MEEALSSSSELFFQKIHLETQEERKKKKAENSSYFGCRKSMYKHLVEQIIYYNMINYGSNFS